MYSLTRCWSTLKFQQRYCGFHCWNHPHGWISRFATLVHPCRLRHLGEEGICVTDFINLHSFTECNGISARKKKEERNHRIYRSDVELWRVLLYHTAFLVKCILCNLVRRVQTVVALDDVINVCSNTPNPKVSRWNGSRESWDLILAIRQSTLCLKL